MCQYLFGLFWRVSWNLLDLLDILDILGLIGRLRFGSLRRCVRFGYVLMTFACFLTSAMVLGSSMVFDMVDVVVFLCSYSDSFPLLDVIWSFTSMRSKPLG